MRCYADEHRESARPKAFDEESLREDTHITVSHCMRQRSFKLEKNKSIYKYFEYLVITWADGMVNQNRQRQQTTTGQVEGAAQAEMA